MKIISHRGYLNGPDQSIENNPAHIKRILSMGLDAEIDVLYEDRFYLGHDKPIHQVDIDFLKSDGLWCHAKSLKSLQAMLSNGIHCFWHEQDKCTLTSKGYIWSFPGVETSGEKTVFLFPERYQDVDTTKYEAICTDFPLQYKKGEKT